MNVEELIAKISIPPEVLFTIGPLRLTNTILTTYVVMALLVWFAVSVSRNLQLVPGRLQNLAEMIIETLLNTVEGSLGRPTRTYFPLIATLFIFILVANWLSLFPLFGTVGLREVEEGHEKLTPFFRAPNSDINTPWSMGLIVFFVVQVTAVRYQGAKGVLKEWAGPVLALSPLMFVVHLVSELSRPLSLSFRLFGNILGGDVLLTVMSFITQKTAVAYVAGGLIPIVFMGLEALFGLVQAIIFSMLTMAYLTLATAHHEAEEHH